MSAFAENVHRWAREVQAIKNPKGTSYQVVSIKLSEIMVHNFVPMSELLLIFLHIVSGLDSWPTEGQVQIFPGQYYLFINWLPGPY